MAVSPAEDVLCFGLFELDLKAGQLHRNGIRIRLPQQPLQLLSILLERPGEVLTREELRQRLWSSDVFVDFDHGLNKSVQKLRDALGDSADSPRYIETIPRVGYRFIAPVNGRPRSSHVSMGLEPSDVEQPDLQSVPQAANGFPVVSVNSKRRYKILWFVMAGGAALLATVVGWHIHVKGQRPEPIQSLAVLPLENLSGDTAQEYFADGITDELTTMLAKNSTLGVTSRTSVMQYKQARRPLRDIARELGVNGILEGSIARSGGRVHMTLQLIQEPTDTHVWAESYDRDDNDLVSLPEEAAAAIARRTDSAIPQKMPARVINPRAHDAYLHGRYLWFEGENGKAGEYFKKTTELQPDYAAAWTGLADYYGVGAIDGDMNPAESLPLQEEAAQRAVTLDDSLPQAHLSLCAAIFLNQWDWSRADRECVRATELDPKLAEAHHFRAKIFAALNRHKEAIEVQKKATELDPFARPWALAYSYLLARQYDAALEETRLRLESSFPHNPMILGILAETYRCKGMKVEAAQAWEDALSAWGDQTSAAALRRAFQRGGYRGALLWELATLKKKSQTGYVSPVDLALQYAQLGQREETLSLLEEGYRQHSPLLLTVQSDPAYDFVHSDERYRSIIRRMGLPPAY